MRSLVAVALAVGLLGSTPMSSHAEPDASTPLAPQPYFVPASGDDETRSVVEPFTIVVVSTDEPVDPESGPVPDGAPAEDRPQLRFELELWAGSQRVWFQDVDATRPVAGLPTYSVAEGISVPEGIAADGDILRLRARAVWPDAPSGVDGVSAWSAWSQATLMIPPPRPTLVSPDSSAVTETSRPRLVASVPPGTATSIGFMILDSVDRPVANGTVMTDSEGQATYQVPDSLSLPSGQYHWQAYSATDRVQSAWTDGSQFEIQVRAVGPEIFGVAPSTARSATVYWWARDPNAEPVTGYSVQTLPDGPTVTVAATSTSANVSGLSPGSTVRFAVRANFPDGTQSEPSFTAPITLSTVPPGTPTDLQFGMRGHEADLTWAAPVDSGGTAITSYLVEYRKGYYGTRERITVDHPAATLTGLDFEQYYFVNVRAVNAKGEGSPSPDFALYPYTTPSAPTIRHLLPNDGELEVTWDPPVSSGGRYVESYVIAASPGEHEITVPADERNSAHLSGLTNDTDYSVTVTAVNAAGASAPSEPMTSRPIPEGIDSDGDTLPDILEFRAHSNHLLRDSDDDGLEDAFEVLQLISNTSPTAADSDDDGIPDGQEDADGDGRTNHEEMLAGTDPSADDSDSDGLGDGVEHIRGTNPLNADTDQDGVPDGLESDLGLDPLNASTHEGQADSEANLTHTVTATGASVEATGTPAQLASLHIGQAPSLSVPGALSKSATLFTTGETQGEDEAISSSSATANKLTLSVPSIAPDESRIRVASRSVSSSTWTLSDKQTAYSDADSTVTIYSPEVGEAYTVVDLRGWSDSLTACEAAATGRPTPLDVDVLLDGTLSVDYEDPTGERFRAAQTVLGALDAGDHATLRMFGYEWTSTGFGGFRSEESALELPRVGDIQGSLAQVREQLRQIESAPATDLDLEFNNLDDDAMGAAEGLLAGPYEESSESDDCRVDVTLLITDGRSSPEPLSESMDDPEEPDAYKPFLQRVDKPVHILDVGPGGSAAAWMIDLAQRSGGSYTHVPTTDPEPLADTAESPDIPDLALAALDSDSDGLSDWIETYGIRGVILSVDGPRTNLLRTDPHDPDTDDDGLTDSQEAGQPYTLSELAINWNPAIPITTYHLVSDPTSEDGDADGIQDVEEVGLADFGVSAIDADVDGDLVNDGEELEWGTEPLVPDTDMDGADDGYEIQATALGWDPTEYDEPINEHQYIEDFMLGMFCGDNSVCFRSTIAWMAGNMASSLLIYGDVRDAVANALEGKRLSAGFIVLGLIPIGGDAASAATHFVKVLHHLTPNQIAGAVQALHKLGVNPTQLVNGISRQYSNVVTQMRATANMSDRSILEILSFNRIDKLEAILSSPKLKHFAYPSGTKNKFMLGGKEGEDFTAWIVLGKNPAPGQTKFLTSKGKARYVDIVEGPIPGAKCHESKVGWAASRLFIRTQIEKDLDLRTQGSTPICGGGVAWHFYASKITNRIGPSESVLKKLENAGIDVYVHFPS